MPQFGIIQGRLTPSPPGCLQWFPQDSWREEFATASAAGLSYIELIAEEQHNPDNPLWSDSGCKEIVALTQKNNLVLYMACNDFVIAHNLMEDTTRRQFSLFIERCRKIGIKDFVLPLFGESAVNRENYDQFAPVIQSIAREADGLRVHLETLLPAKSLLDLLSLLDCDNIGIVYDIGNRAATKVDSATEIKALGSAISHIHVKDKNSKNENVLLGEGNADFKNIFKALRAIEYSGNYSFETTRGLDPIATAKSHLAMVKSLLRDAS